MPEKFQNKYRIESARLRNWDYGWNAPYFVTICTRNRTCFFGDVADGEMMLNDLGKIANDCWFEIPKHFPFVELGAFVVMPNHVHGIVIIDKPNDGRKNGGNGPTVETPESGVSTTELGIPTTELDIPTTELGIPTTELGIPTTELGIPTTELGIPTTESGIPTTNLDIPATDTPNQTTAASEKWKPGTLGVIINQYKRAVTIGCRKIHADFAWQPRFHDHIIRDDESFHRISEYIIHNPANWSDDQFRL